MSPAYQNLAYGNPTQIVTTAVEGNAWEGNLQVHQNKTLKIYTNDNKMTWQGEAFLTCGVVAFALAVVLGEYIIYNV